jgi:transposase
LKPPLSATGHALKSALDGCATPPLSRRQRNSDRVADCAPLRAIRALVNAALERLSPTFERMYAEEGRPSIAPERLLRALLLQTLFTIRSERQLMQQISYNMLFRWFVGLAMDVPVWDVTVFTKNRDRLLQGDVARGFLAAILVEPQVKPLLSSEHFSVDGTLIEAWASMKSFRPKDGSGEPPAAGRNGERDVHGEKRSNQTHASTTDMDARLYKKSPGSAAKLCHMGHVAMENRNGLVVAAEMTPATGTAEREAAVAMVEPLAGGHRGMRDRSPNSGMGGASSHSECVGAAWNRQSTLTRLPAPASFFGAVGSRVRPRRSGA